MRCQGWNALPPFVKRIDVGQVPRCNPVQREDPPGVIVGVATRGPRKPGIFIRILVSGTACQLDLAPAGRELCGRGDVQSGPNDQSETDQAGSYL